MSVRTNGAEQVEVSNIEQFEALFNYATIGMIITNAEGEIIDFNSFAEKQFGYTKDEVLGKTVELLLPNHNQELHVKSRQDYYNSPEVRAMGHGKDLFARKRNGRSFPVDVSLCHYAINGHTFVIAFVIDITVRKKQEEVMSQQKQELELAAEEVKKVNSELEQMVYARTQMLREALIELEKSKEELSKAFLNQKELSELKSRFVTMASHEFRTPLSTILSSTYLLEKYNEVNRDSRVEKHICRIKSAGGAMKEILEDFLSLGKLDEGLVQAKIEKVSAVEIADEVNGLIHELEELLKTGQQINLNNTVSAAVYIDRSLLKNVLTNLILNASKFSNENAAITVSSTLANNHLVISVADNGIGISEDDQAHLFQRFFRARNASNIEGTGLGLHIVREYLTLMNGRIDMFSRLNEGSTFTIYIPQNI